jgi:pimeloyl-ACP methyl ester carboxylesterase
VAIEFAIETPGVRLAGEDTAEPGGAGGDAGTVVLLHGLTATRRYVVMGSRSLERAGHRVVAYDARGHGRSSGSVPPGKYSYELLSRDLEAVLDARGIERTVLAGASMGAHTLVRFALQHPERVAGLVVITPAFDGQDVNAGGRLAHWDALAAGLRSGGIEGFVAAYDLDQVAPGLRDTVATVIRQRLSLHSDLGAIADALQAVPRSRPFETMPELESISVPVAVVASNDAADPEHPQAVGEAYAAAIPGARLVLDEPGHSPVAWQGSQLSRVIAEVATAGA